MTLKINGNVKLQTINGGEILYVSTRSPLAFMGTYTVSPDNTIDVPDQIAVQLIGVSLWYHKTGSCSCSDVLINFTKD